MKAGGLGGLWGNPVLRLCICIAGIMGSFLAYGVIQEKIMTKPYGVDESGEGILFPYSAFLVFNNRIVSVLGSAVILTLQGESLGNIAPVASYFGISFSNVVATFCQYEALKWVSFPTQTLGKNAYFGKKYGIKDYAIAAGITSGVMIFVLTGEIGSKKLAESGSDSTFGLLLMAGYLFSDGFTSTFQEKLFKGYTMPTYNQMLWVNLCSACTSIVALLVQGQLFAAVAFATTYPQLMIDAFLLSLCSMVGQTFIYTTIKSFGALTFSTIMTTRQFIAIGLSCLIYFHPLTMGQWFGAVVVFGTLYYKAALKGKKKPAARPPPDEEQPEINNDLLVDQQDTDSSGNRSE